MAGVTIPLTSISLVFLPRSELRALAQVPRIQQSFWPRHSRASCSWTRYNPTHQSRPVSRARNLRGYQLGRVGLFSTSNPRQLEGRDGNKHQSKGSPSIPGKSESPPSPTAKLTSALKSKLAPLRHENIYTIPNILTLSRLIATPAIGYLIIHNHHLYAFSLFAYAGFSDLLDGWIARRWNLQTVVGSVVDPMADKILMTTLVTCLAINGSLPLPLATLMIGRDASLAIAALYYRYASLPAPKTMARYWDFSLPSAEVHPTTISKFNTFLQLSLLGTLLCTNLLHDPSAITSAAGGFLLSIQGILGGEEGVRNMVKGMSAVVASTTMYSGLEYVWKKDAVKILGKDEELKKRQGRNGRMIIGSAFGAFIVLAGWLWSREGAKADEKDEEN